MQDWPPNDRIHYIYFPLSHLPPLTTIQCSLFQMVRQVQMPWLHSQPVPLLLGFSHSLLPTRDSHTALLTQELQEVWKEGLVSAPRTFIAFTISSFFPK